MQGASKYNKEPISPEHIKINQRKPSVRLRWLTALIMMPVILLFVWFGGWAAFAIILLIGALGAYEFNAMLVHSGYHPLTWISLGLSTLMLFAAMFPQQPELRLLLLEIGFGASLLLTFPWLFFRRNLEGAIVDWAFTLAIAIYLGLPSSFLMLLRGYEPGQVHLGSGTWFTIPAGIWWLLATLLGVWGFDAAAFFTGRYLGRHKLAPTISPGKTWEGVLGGFVLCIIACLLTTVIPLGVPWYLAIVLGLLIGSAAVIGDLAESLIKRQMHVKDSGQIMPGHGGMLDRVDSVLFVVLVVYFFAYAFGGIPK